MHQSERCSKLFEFHHSTVTKVILNWMAFETAVSLTTNGPPSKVTLRSDSAMLVENPKNLQAPSQTRQDAVSRLQVQVDDNAERLKACLEKLQEKASDF